jgi:hypothetical protein
MGQINSKKMPSIFSIQVRNSIAQITARQLEKVRGRVGACGEIFIQIMLPNASLTQHLWKVQFEVYVIIDVVRRRWGKRKHAESYIV